MLSKLNALLGLSLVASYASAALINFGAPINARGLSKRAPGEVVTRCRVPGTAALTFDDGPYNDLREISDTLTRAGARGTFYFNGNNWRCIYDEDMASSVKYAYDAGHQIASHTWHHAHLNTLSQHDIHVELWLVEQAIHRITGAYPAFVRPPFGEYNSLLVEAATMRGMTITNWDFDSGDTSAPGVSAASTLAAYRNVIATRPSNILTLMHEITPSTTEVLPQVISELQAAGYRLVTAAECLGEEPYLWIDPPRERDAEWRCPARR